MGLFLCQICDEELDISIDSITGFTTKHICNQEDIKKYINELKERTRMAENRLEDIDNAVLMTVQDLPSLVPEEIVIKTKWLRKLWKSAGCQWDESKTSDNFSIRWLTTHLILIAAFDLFQSKEKRSFLQKLKDVRERCDSAKIVLGYQDSVFDLTPEDLVKVMN